VTEEVNVCKLPASVADSLLVRDGCMISERDMTGNRSMENMELFARGKCEAVISRELHQTKPQ
jgi:hypothetical protein